MSTYSPDVNLDYDPVPVHMGLIADEFDKVRILGERVEVMAFLDSCHLGLELEIMLLDERRKDDADYDLLRLDRTLKLEEVAHLHKFIEDTEDLNDALRRYDDYYETKLIERATDAKKSPLQKLTDFLIPLNPKLHIEAGSYNDADVFHDELKIFLKKLAGELGVAAEDFKELAVQILPEGREGLEEFKLQCREVVAKSKEVADQIPTKAAVTSFGLLATVLQGSALPNPDANVKKEAVEHMAKYDPLRQLASAIQNSSVEAAPSQPVIITVSENLNIDKVVAGVSQITGQSPEEARQAIEALNPNLDSSTQVVLPITAGQARAALKSAENKQMTPDTSIAIENTPTADAAVAAEENIQAAETGPAQEAKALDIEVISRMLPHAPELCRYRARS